MTNQKTSDLFPFPVYPASEGPAVGHSTSDLKDSALSEPGLPAFPNMSMPEIPLQVAEEIPPLSQGEIAELRVFLSERHQSRSTLRTMISLDSLTVPRTNPADVPLGSPQAAIPVDLPQPGTSGEYAGSEPNPCRATLRAAFEQLSGPTPSESALLKQMADAIELESDPQRQAAIWYAVAGVFPVRDCLRHGTPDQKRFALIALGDRFLLALGGTEWAGRRTLLQAVARHLSDASEGLAFLTMEGEPFHPQYHERVSGSASSGRMIREMHGFVVVRRPGDQLVRMGRVLT